MHMISLLRREFGRLSRDAQSRAKAETALDQWQSGRRLTRRACAFLEAESKTLYPALVVLQSEPPLALMERHLHLMHLGRNAEALLKAQDLSAESSVREFALKLSEYAEEHERTLWPRLLALMVDAELKQVGGEMLMALAERRLEAAAPTRRQNFVAMMRVFVRPVSTVRRVTSPHVGENLPVLQDVIAGTGGGGNFTQTQRPTPLAWA